MESDSWSRFSAAALLSKRQHSSSREANHANVRAYRDLLMGVEEGDDGGEEDASRAEFACPFCYEDFDVIGLCCHVEDEHPVEAKNGVCPVCASRVGQDLVGHITTQHGSFYKIQRRRRLRRGAIPNQAMLSLLKRDLRDGTLQALLRDSAYTLPASTGTSDPLLSSLIYTIPESESSKNSERETLNESTLINEPSEETLPLARTEPSLSYKDLKERIIRSEFMQELVLSTMFDDAL